MRYDFPVSIQDIYTKAGSQVPRVRAVVNDETGEALAPVSTKYALIEHKIVMDEALKFAEAFGAPQTRFFTSPRGDHALAEFTFMDKTLAIQKGDMVGLRVYAENSYNAKSSAKLQVGALRLACMNGMVMAKTAVALNIRHVGHPEVKFPDINSVWQKFTASTNTMQEYTKLSLGYNDFKSIAEEAVKEGVGTERALQSIKDGGTVWDMYNMFTYDITHRESEKASYIGKVKRLNRVSQWFEDRFQTAPF
jgi:hypothetical protein